MATEFFEVAGEGGEAILKAMGEDEGKLLAEQLRGLTGEASQAMEATIRSMDTEGLKTFFGRFGEASEFGKVLNENAGELKEFAGTLRKANETVQEMTKSVETAMKDNPLLGKLDGIEVKAQSLVENFQKAAADGTLGDAAKEAEKSNSVARRVWNGLKSTGGKFFLLVATVTGIGVLIKFLPKAAREAGKIITWLAQMAADAARALAHMIEAIAKYALKLAKGFFGSIAHMLLVALGGLAAVGIVVLIIWLAIKYGRKGGGGGSTG